MARTRIKFCGLRSAEDLAAAARAGADAVGFVFHPGSPRSVEAAAVRLWLRDTPPWMHSVFLFMNAPDARIRQVLDQVQPDYLQFHGQESPADCVRYGLPWIKALPMGAPEEARKMQQEHSQAALFLADSHGGERRSGGSGHPFDWSLIATLPQSTLIAGGLHADNVGPLIRGHRPWGVDVSSGIEIEPGRKSPPKMESFVEAVRAADADLSTLSSEHSTL